MGNKAYTRHLRVAGNVAPGSIERSGANAQFVLMEQGRTLKVNYQGDEPPPDTFKDDAQALAIGTLGRDGVFHATELQAKCASKYAPANKSGSTPAAHTAAACPLPASKDPALACRFLAQPIPLHGRQLRRKLLQLTCYTSIARLQICGNASDRCTTRECLAALRPLPCSAPGFGDLRGRALLRLVGREWRGKIDAAARARRIARAYAGSRPRIFERPDDRQSALHSHRRSSPRRSAT